MVGGRGVRFGRQMRIRLRSAVPGGPGRRIGSGDRGAWLPGPGGGSDRIPLPGAGAQSVSASGAPLPCTKYGGT